MAVAKYRFSGFAFGGHIHGILSSEARKRNGSIRVTARESNLSESNSKKAKLSASKKERVTLPNYGENGSYHFREFVSHPSGVEAILNTRALQSYRSIDSTSYRCVLPQIQLFDFRVAPVLDLQVIPTSEDCTVEMLACKFEGSEVVERQNKYFSASMRNCIRWESSNEAEQFLDVDVTLNLVLEIYTLPFTLLPISAVEGPGNIVMQALLDQLVPLLVQQLLQDYKEWIRQQAKLLQ